MAHLVKDVEHARLALVLLLLHEVVNDAGGVPHPLGARHVLNPQLQRPRFACGLRGAPD